MYTLAMQSRAGKLYHSTIKPEGRSIAVFHALERNTVSFYTTTWDSNGPRFNPIDLTPVELVAAKAYCQQNIFK